ncbi:leucine-rich PPR motif-containing protein, mitochondrial [Phlebotomus argentipes]|uniref:leucine-rich PPR motif-containing protein, mitochondrial n=1 Tax=Phlebotomus argentipes TaxID=94469 RepID=UPI0028934125|nr:leucine-rich PPR motif-containing protein, mitochondrial [Phlebotomus argentipes]
MAGILRGSKLVRYFAGFARSIAFSTSRELEGNVLQQGQCFCGHLSQGFSTNARSDQNLDRSLKRLDQDVRRSGRISRRDIEEILEEIRLQRSATSSQSLLVIRCCGNLVPEELPEVRTALVQEIWHTLNNLNVPMDISHYNALLRVYLENEHPFSPTEFLSDLEAKGVEPNRVTYQRLIARYCQEGDIEGATRILEFMREKQLPVNENVFNALILGHSQADDMESAVGILNVMQQAGLEPSADTYTTLLCGYAKKGDVEAIKKTLAECEKKEIFLLDKDILDVLYALTVSGHGKDADALLSCVRKSVGYNQDAVNTILRLTNRGEDEVALKILRTMPRNVKANGDVSDTGNFFIRQMVKAKLPVARILTVCNNIQEEGLNSRPLLVAIEAGLNQGNVEIVMPLLKRAKEMGFPMRPHYFWPLLCSAAKSKSTPGVVKVLKQMQEEFDMQANSETIREYVIPHLKAKAYDVMRDLIDAGLSPGIVCTSVVYNELLKGDLKKAAEISTAYRAFYVPSLFRRPLISALNSSKDCESFIKIIRQIYDGMAWMDRATGREQSEETNENEGEANQHEFLGQIVYDVAAYFRQSSDEMLRKVLEGLVQEGLSISSRQAERIQEKLGSELTVEISTSLGQLASGELEPVPLSQEEGSRRTASVAQMSATQLERIIEQVEAKGENAKGLKRYLLGACFRSKDLQKSEEVIQRLEAEGYTFTSGVYAQMIDLYCYHEKLEKVLETYKLIKEKEPEFLLDNMKTIRVISLLLNEERVDEALDFLQKNQKSECMDETVFNYRANVWKMLNALAEKGQSETLNKVFTTLEAGRYIEVSNVLLGPLIKVHLVKDDLTKAMDTFEQISEKYQVTPWKSELACRLIQAEDANNLQRLTNLSTKIHGEVNSLYDLVFSFVECGRIRQARKILETPGLRMRYQRLSNVCERYSQEGMVQPLEGLVEATKDLLHINRADIYYNLLVSYCKDDAADKALGLWTKMQEEDITPSDAFLEKLGKFLQSKNLDVPFAVPNAKRAVEKEQITEAASSAPKPSKENLNIVPVASTVSVFRKALKEGNVDSVVAAYQKLSPADKLNITHQSQFLEMLVKDGRFQEANQLLQKMLQENTHPIPRVFRFYLNKIASSGDIAQFEKISQYLSPEMKKVISFDNRQCHAYVASGRAGEYLDMLEKELSMAKSDEDRASLTEKFPRGGAQGILQHHPELSDKFEILAGKFMEQKISSPMNVLWIHYFITGNQEKQEKIWREHLKDSPRLMFQRIVQTARENEDVNLVQQLIDKLTGTSVTDGALGNVYSCLLDIHSAREQYDLGLQALNAAVEKKISLQTFNRTALTRLKDGLEKAGKQFPHKIPEKSSQTTEDSSSSSSSSSDDEPERPRK